MIRIPPLAPPASLLSASLLFASLLFAAPAQASGSMSTSFWQKVEAEWLAKFARQHVMNPASARTRPEGWEKGPRTRRPGER